MRRAWMTTKECARALGERYADVLRHDGYEGDLAGVCDAYDRRYIKQAIDAGELQCAPLPARPQQRQTYRILRPDFEVYLHRHHPRLGSLRHAS